MPTFPPLLHPQRPSTGLDTTVCSFFYFHRLPLVAVCVGYVDRHRMCVCIYFTHFFIALPVINEVISRPVIFVTPFFLVFFFVSSTCFSLIFNGPERFGWVSVFVCFRESFEISRNKRRNKATIPRLRYLYMHFAACNSLLGCCEGSLYLNKNSFKGKKKKKRL